jgi:uncharacterized protein YqeY
MATLTARLEEDYKIALKAGERLRVDTLRLIKAAIQRVAIDKRKDALDDAEILQVLAQQAKQRRETIESSKNTSRQDIFTQATQELALLNSYLPQQLSTEAVKQLIEDAVAAVGTNQGQIMKHVMGKAAGTADGKLVSQLVSERLKKG